MFSRRGLFLRKFRNHGVNKLWQPEGITITPEQDIIVCDSKGIQILSSNGDIPAHKFHPKDNGSVAKPLNAILIPDTGLLVTIKTSLIKYNDMKRNSIGKLGELPARFFNYFWTYFDIKDARMLRRTNSDMNELYEGLRKEWKIQPLTVDRLKKTKALFKKWARLTQTRNIYVRNLFSPNYNLLLYRAA